MSEEVYLDQEGLPFSFHDDGRVIFNITHVEIRRAILRGDDRIMKALKRVLINELWLKDMLSKDNMLISPVEPDFDKIRDTWERK